MSSLNVRLDVASVNLAARHSYIALLRSGLPNGHIKWDSGTIYVALDPYTAGREPRTYRIDLETGGWRELHSGRWGNDPVSLARCLFDCSEADGVIRIAVFLGVTAFESEELI